MSEKRDGYRKISAQYFPDLKRRQEDDLMRKKTYRLLSAVLILVLAAGMCGCRPSSRLEKLRYTADGADTDTEQEQIDIEEDGRIEDFLHNVKEQEALKDLADEQRIGPEDEEYGSDGDAVKVAYRSEDEDRKAEDSPSDEKPDIIYDDAGIEQYEMMPEARAADTGSMKQIADASGEEVRLPKNVNRVTAVGTAAQIVELVAGSGRLAGCDASTLDNEFCRLLMPDLSSVERWWEDDGSIHPVSDENFQKILADPEIDVCFEISGQETFTEEQIQILEAYQISYVALYPFDDLEHLRDNVRIVGQVMTNGSGDKNDSVSRAESYISWMDACLNDAAEDTKNFRRYTVYIAGWDDSASYRLTLSDSNPFPDSQDVDADFGLSQGRGSGLAYAFTRSASQLFTELAGYANVENTSTLSTVRISEAENTNYVYVTPVFESFRAGGGQQITGTFSIYDGNINAGYSPFLYRLLGSTSLAALGTGDFPAVIVSSEEVMRKIADDPFWNYSGYCGPLFTGNYSVYVNPRGMGDWISGSLESPLEASWVAFRICRTCTEEEMTGRIMDFYSRFFPGSQADEETEKKLQELVRNMLETYTDVRKMNND